MNNKPADTRSYATKQRSEPGKGDDIPCVRCGAIALDTGLECNECGFDNYEVITGKPFSVSAGAKPGTIAL